MAIRLAPAVSLFMLDYMKRSVAAQPPIHWKRSGQLSSKRDLLNQGRTEPFFNVLLKRWECCTGHIIAAGITNNFQINYGFSFQPSC